ncbi:hypothetical protein FEE96_03500 [Parasedimentitalea maritima]|uniref:Polysaccharide pyruvyl transferase domain-containing protein n=1 Tax=Parasedimentitalea maritima TaxID=2578117 RepID=A0ABY2V2Y4_9RHOB|nr:polysaccharide pyruvyl transferase family protein [Zongyanglinia marina]TLP69360.1 hypothetical protein FEE96_03500 [Zongyanglinia marina]
MSEQEGSPPAKMCDMQNYFHFDANNIGDQASGPSNYFFRSLCEKHNFKSPPPLDVMVLFGGGSIFQQMEQTIAANQGDLHEKSLVAWGVGLPPKGRRDVAVHSLVSNFDLVGTRNFDWSDEYDFVPCASCMSPQFDTLPEVTHEVVVFKHHRKTPTLQLPDDIPQMTNRLRPLKEVIDFLASGETVVTSSYHGVYWAQLLGKKVVCVPFNNKFYSFEYPPLYSSVDNCINDVRSATQYESTLTRYRKLNVAYWEKVVTNWKAKGLLS